MEDEKPWIYRSGLVPSVYTEKHFLFLIGTKKRDFLLLTQDQRKFCYVDKLEKKNGGFREIWKPRRDLKKLLGKINQRYLSRLSYPDFVHCGPQGRSIVTATRGHRHFSTHLSLDVTAFFDNVSEDEVRKALSRARVASEVTELIVAAGVAEDKLPQGFPTSSLLSALVMSQALEGFYSKFNRGSVLLSVYADDILISSNDQNIIADAKRYIEDGLRNVGLSLNEKECLAQAGEQFVWLSLQIHPWVSVPRKKLLELEKKIYEYKMTGIVPADFKPKKPGNLIEQWEESLKGKVVFANTINRSRITNKALRWLASMVSARKDASNK